MEEERQHQPGQQYDPGPNRFTFFAGVIMPAISITVEATTHICAEAFFDPIPTIWHLLLVIFVPLAQIQVWFAIRRRNGDRLALAGFLNAVTIGISIFYSIVYLPLLPMAMLALLFGLGLLPLAPFLSLLASLIMRHQLKRVAATTPQRSFAVKARGLLAGLALTAAVIGMVELPATVTTFGLHMATSSTPQTRSDGISFLRKYGSKDALLRSCYNRTGWATDLIGSAFSLKNPVTPEEARKVYYRVTGETFDASIPPERVGVKMVTRDTIDFDRNQGGTTVGGGKLEGLSLASSKLDGKVDADGGVGYVEWTLVFRNDSDVQREARAEVQLPPGGIVSRLTLWVNGEEREAAFGGRGQVRAAYQKVAIQERRDPVLVTTAGRDRVLVQCFPVPPNKGEMKIRFGITLPLVLEDETHATLLLPHFVFRNFGIPDEVKHAVSVQGKTPMWPFNSAVLQSRQGDVFSVAGMLTDEWLSNINSSITLNRYDVKQVWSKDPFNPGFVITQSVAEHSHTHLRRIVLVVDTSATMRNYIDEIQRAIGSLPPGLDVKLVFANDDVSSESIAFTNSNGEETAEQYRASGLQPVDPGTVPTIPEPEMVALLIVAGAFLIWLTYMKYRKQGRGSCTL